MEVRYSPMLHTRRGLTLTTVVEAVLGGLRQAQETYGIESNVILCGIRNVSPQSSLEMAELAVAYKNRGVVGFDLAGAEYDNPAKHHKSAFQLVRDNNIQGVIRILFGSTRKLGAGTHFPDRLLEVRHVDCPLRPIDRWQRDGRQIRPGNRYKRVYNYSYVTTGRPYQNEKHKTIQGLSPDSYLYEVNLRKANFILAGFYEESDERTMEDIDETTLDFATLVATATGDPRFKEKVALDNTISGLLLEELSYQGTQAVVKQKLHTLPRLIEEAQTRLQRYEADQTTRQPTSARQFTITLNSVVYKKRTEASEALQAIADALYKGKLDGYEDVGTFAGFTLMVQNLPVSDQTLLHLKGKQTYTAVVRDTPKGTLQALEAALDNIEKQINETTEVIAKYLGEQVALQPIAGKPFEQAAALEAALRRQEELNRELGVVEQGAEDAEAPRTVPPEGKTAVETAVATV